MELACLLVWCLGNVINALTTAGKKHVPCQRSSSVGFSLANPISLASDRDSKLTRLLSDSLGGLLSVVTCSDWNRNPHGRQLKDLLDHYWITVRGQR